MVSTPARQRGRLSQSRAPSSAQRETPRAVTPPEMPPYEPPEAPLTAESHRQIAALLQSHQLRQLKMHLGKAAEALTLTAGEVNDRLCDARGRFEKNKERRFNEEVEGNADGEEHAQLGETETKVNNVTGRMEEKIRQIIDSEMRLQGLVDTMTTIEREEGEAQAAALGGRRTRGQRRPRRRGGEDEDEEGEGEEDPDFEATPEREARELNAQNPPSRRLDGGLQEGSDKWNELSLFDRYVVYWMRWLPALADHLTGTPRIIRILGSTAWCTSPNSPATKSLQCRTRRDGLRTWRVPLRPVQPSSALRVVANHLSTRTILQLSESAFLSNARSLCCHTATPSPAPNAPIALSARRSRT